MSTTLRPARCMTGALSMTRFYGGNTYDTCVQLTFKKPESERGKLDYGYWYMQLTREQAREMGESLLAFAEGREEECEM